MLSGQWTGRVPLVLACIWLAGCFSAGAPDEPDARAYATARLAANADASADADAGSTTCTPGDKGYCHYLGVCKSDGTGCKCDDEEHRKSEERCAVWHPQLIGPGQNCAPGNGLSCNYNGVCDPTGMFCICSSEWWHGPFCSLTSDKCPGYGHQVGGWRDDVCFGKGTCVPSADDPSVGVCECEPGATGPDCNSADVPVDPVDPCDPSPCADGLTCELSCAQTAYRVPHATVTDWQGPPQELGFVGDTLFFGALDPDEEKLGVWTSDGTEAGTQFVTHLVPPGGGNNSVPRVFGAVGDRAIIRASNQAGYMWSSDGTAGGTGLLQAADAVVLYDDGDTAWLGGPALSTTDGTAAGTQLVAPVMSEAFHGAALLNGKLIFAGKDADGMEPWVSDGTAAGTFQLADLRAGAPGSSPGGFLALGSYVLFGAEQTNGLRQVWRTDGTAAGTELLSTASTTVDRRTNGFAVMDGAAWFGSAPTAGNNSWYRTDGTTQGTASVVDLGPDVTVVGFPVVVGNRFFFQAHTPAAEFELWVSDGTTDGTRMVKDIGPGAAWGVGPSSSMVAGKHGLFFVANDGVHGRELWRSDGTEAGTLLVADLSPPQTAPSDAVLHLAVRGDGTAFFWSYVGTTPGGQKDYELFRTEPTDDCVAVCVPEDRTTGHRIDPSRWPSSRIDFEVDDRDVHVPGVRPDRERDGTRWLMRRQGELDVLGLCGARDTEREQRDETQRDGFSIHATWGHLSSDRSRIHRREAHRSPTSCPGSRTRS